MSFSPIAASPGARASSRALGQANTARNTVSDDEAASEAKALGTLAAKQRHFDFALEERAELQREAEALDTLLLSQMKHQDEILKAWLRLA